MEEITKTIEEASSILNRTAGVVDKDGTVIACTDPARVGSVDKLAAEIFLSDDDFAVTGNASYRKFGPNESPELVCFIEGTEQAAQINLDLLVNWLEAELEDGDEAHERETLVKNILLENELPGDIPLKAREYSIPYAAIRVVYSIKVKEENSLDSLEILKNMYPRRQVDFILPMDENTIALVKEFRRGEEEKVNDIAHQIVDTLSTEAMGKVKVGVGMPVETLRDISKSYREANLALTIGGIFKPTEDIMRYDNLGLGRLIYQLPPTLCQMFLDEVFEDKSYEQLDQEIINTIDTFFECDLNGSETSRKLFVHRNTLVYRLDKVQKITGLDVRTFEDAVLFKLASMVKKYLDYLENKSKLASEDKWWRT